MSAATVPGGPGATALGRVHHHRLGDALHAVQVYTGAAFDVLLFGEYYEEAGLRRHGSHGALRYLSSPRRAARPRP
ncbi:hypothetical protein NGF19_21485 [Streptomyces sp. RY43-2]|uniref:Uncharacterized protein n=1 Tax=Streptomyces macrolidinus TaxID=2952607 RepID=A0ABT0ZIA4_9ACTN|nr:hypothetical protein [Streptomyces macrolidinus]MCN9243322.1 hypothetical protein [Streptomyces macrolidinus]